MVTLESRAEMAEAERDAAAESMATMTPRPARPAPAAAQLLGAEGADLLQQVVQHYRCAQFEMLKNALCARRFGPRWCSCWARGAGTAAASRAALQMGARCDGYYARMRAIKRSSCSGAAAGRRGGRATATSRTAPQVCPVLNPPERLSAAVAQLLGP